MLTPEDSRKLVDQIAELRQNLKDFENNVACHEINSEDRYVEVRRLLVDMQLSVSRVEGFVSGIGEVLKMRLDSIDSMLEMIFKTGAGEAAPPANKSKKRAEKAQKT